MFLKYTIHDVSPPLHCACQHTSAVSGFRGKRAEGLTRGGLVRAQIKSKYGIELPGDGKGKVNFKYLWETCPNFALSNMFLHKRVGHDVYIVKDVN